jgi:hypothetical protein
MKTSFDTSILAATPIGTLQLAARAIALDRLADRYGITCGDEEIQQAADYLRDALDLLTVEDTRRWLARRGLSVPAWSRELRTDVREKKLNTHSQIETVARRRLDADPDRFCKVNAGEVVVEDEGVANELRILLAESDISFHVLARRYSIIFADGAHPHPASCRTLFLDTMPSSIAMRILAGPTPLPHDVEPHLVNGLWVLYRIYTIEGPSYDQETSEYLRALVIEEMLRPLASVAYGDLLKCLGCDVPAALDEVALLTFGERELASLRRTRTARTIQTFRLDRVCRS